jgi:hypothetical protein
MKNFLNKLVSKALLLTILVIAVITFGNLMQLAQALTPGANHTILAGGGDAVLNTTVNNFIPMVGVHVPVISTSEGTVAVPMAMVGHLHDLYCQTVTIAGVLTAAGGTSVKMVVDQNEVNTTLTCTETASLTHCSDTTHDVLIAVGDQISVEDIPTGTPTATVVQCTVELDL